MSEVDNLYREIGRRIVELRKSKSMSQEKLAADSGIDRSHIGFIEQGRRKPTLSTLQRITKVLDVKLEELFRGF